MDMHIQFFLFPREIRDIIYAYYVLHRQGYSFNIESGKLTGANGKPIDLALMYTCKTAAAEMKDLALQMNTITFSTVPFNKCNTRDRASRHDAITNDLHDCKTLVLQHVMHCITPEMRTEMENKYSKKLVERLLHPAITLECLLQEEFWGVAPSTFRNFFSFALQLASTHPEFEEAIRGMHETDRMTFANSSFSAVLSMCAPPWALPTDDELTTLEGICTPDNFDAFLRRDYLLKYQFSAVAAAIHFLTSVPDRTRRQIRKIVIREDRKSAAFPECHAQGLIPFCLENPKLQIERRVDMWSSVFPGITDWRSLHYVSFSPERPRSPFDDRSICTNIVTLMLMQWIEEALSLASHGMPPGSFTLYFEAQPAESSQQLFDVVRRNAAWQEALDGFYRRKNISVSPVKDRKHICYWSESFPDAMKNIVEGNSFIHFDASLGESWEAEVERLSRENWNCTLDEWAFNYRASFPVRLTTIPPMTSWLDLQTGYIFPDSYELYRSSRERDDGGFMPTRNNKRERRFRLLMDRY